MADQDRAKAFYPSYTGKAGFRLDVDHRAGDFPVVRVLATTWKLPTQSGSLKLVTRSRDR